MGEDLKRLKELSSLVNLGQKDKDLAFMEESLELLNKVTQSAFWYILCDEEGKIKSITYSQGLRQLIGRHDTQDFPDELSAWESLIHPKDKERVLHNLYSSLADKTAKTMYNIEYRLQLPDGTYQWFRSRAEIYRRADGTAIRMAGIFMNIDQDVRAKQLAQSSEAFHRAFTEANLCEYYIDLHENSFTSLKVNATLQPLFDSCHSWDDFVEAFISSFVYDEDKEAVAKIYNRSYIAQNLTPNQGELSFEGRIRLEGDERWMRIVVIRDEAIDTSRFALSFIRDITEARNMERESRKALKDAFEAANRANRAKTDFLTNMSHDIRTPMNAIVGMTAIAGANIDNKARVMDCLAKITQSSRHLLGLLNEVLDMARIESGHIALDEEEFSLSDLVDNIIVMTKHAIEEHHHIFNVHLHKIEHEDVCGDSLRIQQLLTNILTNAVKYTPDGGNVSFSIAEIPTQSQELGCYEFVIEDNGIGMSKEFQSVLFDPFTRADDKRTTKVQGTGLGMAIAKNIVNMMNGDIKVESTPGKGSKFTVRIFLKLQAKIPAKIDELIGLPVLVVDDDLISCENTVAILQEIGIDGEYVTSGQQAIELTYQRFEENNNFFAIILDWKMPDMDGIETARRIRQRVGKDVTIIILSAYDCTAFEAEARKAGVNEFISKPLFRSRLTATLKNVLEGRNIQKHEADYLKDISSCDYSDKRILIVEDNELNAEIAKVIIEMTGAKTEIATNGKEAVDAFLAAPTGYYDLIFMDIQMPIMNGYEATAAIRALNKADARTIPIVAMTANAFAEDVVMAKNSGMNEHMAKPIDMNKLRDVLGRWL